VRPEDHCAINVCLYSPGANRWTMTERAARHVRCEHSSFVVGPSRVVWNGRWLEIALDERSVPWARTVRGTLRVHPHALSHFAAPLDAAGRHRWAPIAPCARIEVALDTPALRWQGAAYLDSNEGDEPIERAFTRWDWLRTASPQGRTTTVIYDVQAPGAQAAAFIARRFEADGSDHAVDAAPSRVALAAAPVWRVERSVRADEGARVMRTLEDTPFYARSLIEMPSGGSGACGPAVHETLDVRRLRSSAVQAMLPWRMPRRR
jgi:carotenoid 1,2-hydratase